jgi:hypothetical protein
VSVVDSNDVLLTRQEVSAGIPAIGLPHMNQAWRVARLQLDRSIRGNAYVELETSVKAFGLRPGDIVTLTYAKMGYARQPFRVMRIAPGVNFETAVITAQIHQDEWYTDEVRAPGPSHSQPRNVAYPRPLVGSRLNDDGDSELEIVETIRAHSDQTGGVWLSARFLTPRTPTSTALPPPLLSLSPAITVGAGALPGGRTFYYALAAVDANGAEGPLSFIVAADVPAGPATSRVTHSQLSFAPGASAFSVYRGEDPQRLLRIASSIPLSDIFEDPGLPHTLDIPPDPNFAHANFYWRFEHVPPTTATIHGANSVGNEVLQMIPDEYNGAVVRIIGGRGAGQELAVVSNSSTTLTLTKAWTIEPDATSVFAVAEGGWRFAARSSTSPAEFEVPNRGGMTVQIMGRAANAFNHESAADISPLSRWRIGGSVGAGDQDVAGAPLFSLSARGRGALTVGAVGFETLDNTRNVMAATLTLLYWDELDSPSTRSLRASVPESAVTVEVEGDALGEGDIVQVGGELMRVERVDGSGYQMGRAAIGSAAAAHAAGEPVYRLKRHTTILPFARDFFGSPAAGSFTHSMSFPNARVAAAEMFVTNGRGNSDVRQECFTVSEDFGLRTLSGGQINLEIGGPLALETDAGAPYTADADAPIRDMFATVRTPPAAGRIRLSVQQNDQPIGELEISAGGTQSQTVSGFGLAPLRRGARVKVNVIEVPTAADSVPGSDLTVTIRL